MLRTLLGLGFFCAACVAEQPESAKMVAAYEIPLPTDPDKRRFLALLTQKAEAAGYHVDAVTQEELKILSKVSPQTFSASVWRGKDDEESIAVAMDFKDHLGRVWIIFSRGEDPIYSQKFRESLVPALIKAWPETASLPIMPGGSIPLSEDLVRTPQGYTVKPSAAAKYSVTDGGR